MNPVISSFFQRFLQTLQYYRFNRIERQRLIEEFYHCSVSSCYIICLCGFFVGSVLSIQGIHMLEKFSADNQIGYAVTLSILRELGPVTCSLLYVGNVCSATTSALAIHRLSQQNQAIISMGIDIYKYLYFPRLCATILTLPLLFFIFTSFATIGAFITSTQLYGIDPGHFWSNIHEYITATDLISGLIKVFVFSFFINIIAFYYGRNANLSSAGISMATTHCVVAASVVIFILDTLLTVLFLGGLWS